MLATKISHTGVPLMSMQLFSLVCTSCALVITAVPSCSHDVHLCASVCFYVLACDSVCFTACFYVLLCASFLSCSLVFPGESLVFPGVPWSLVFPGEFLVFLGVPWSLVFPGVPW